MESNWAAENLRTIRTLMERAAVYRRALAPIMIFCGVVGVAGGILGWQAHINTTRGFVEFWIGMAVLGLAGSFMLMRRQALKDSEPFWSPPTRRVAQALLPPFVIGAVVAGTFCTFPEDAGVHPILVVVWAWAYGCATCAAGSFMPRGIKLLGWTFIIVGCGLVAGWLWRDELNEVSPHLLMGAIFGGLHLAYGIYLYFTEKRGNES